MAERKTLAITSESQAGTPAVAPLDWSCDSQQTQSCSMTGEQWGTVPLLFPLGHEWVQFRGYQINFLACYGRWVLRVGFDICQFVNVTVCTQSGPAETSAAGELARPNQTGKRKKDEKRGGEGGGKLIKCVGRCDSSVCFVCRHVPLYVWDKYSGSIGQNEPTTQIRVPWRCQIKIRDGLDSTCASSILLWITVSQGWKWW